MNFYLSLADLVAVVHAAYVAFVVIGFALIIAGLVMRREWSMAFWFRAAHLVAIAFVCTEALMGVVCRQSIAGHIPAGNVEYPPEYNRADGGADGLGEEQ